MPPLTHRAHAGKIFCDVCTSARVSVDGEAEQRACDTCAPYFSDSGAMTPRMSGRSSGLDRAPTTQGNATFNTPSPFSRTRSLGSARDSAPNSVVQQATIAAQEQYARLEGTTDNEVWQEALKTLEMKRITETSVLRKQSAGYKTQMRMAALQQMRRILDDMHGSYHRAMMHWLRSTAESVCEAREAAARAHLQEEHEAASSLVRHGIARLQDQAKELQDYKKFVRSNVDKDLSQFREEVFVALKGQIDRAQHRLEQQTARNAQQERQMERQAAEQLEGRLNQQGTSQQGAKPVVNNGEACQACSIQ